jgi:hypothetical protein
MWHSTLDPKFPTVWWRIDNTATMVVDFSEKEYFLIKDKDKLWLPKQWEFSYNQGA